MHAHLRATGRQHFLKKILLIAALLSITATLSLEATTPTSTRALSCVYSELWFYQLCSILQYNRHLLFILKPESTVHFPP